MGVEQPDNTDDGDGLYPFRLDFTVDGCDTCGMQRSVEAPCPGCGQGDAVPNGPTAERRVA